MTSDGLNVAIGATVRAEAARRGWSTDELARRSGISRRTMFRLVDPNPPPDRDPGQWKAEQIEAVATAFGLRVSELIGLAETPRVTSLKSEDPRTLITYLIAHPEHDEELQTRLGEAESHTGLRGSRLAALRETIRNVRREELEHALAALPPSAAQGGNKRSG